MKLKGIYKFFSFLAECKGSIIDAGSGLPYCGCMENILALLQSKDVGDIQICKKATLALRKKLLSFVRKCRDHSNLQGGNFNIKKQTFFWQLHWSVKDKIIIVINSPSKQNQNPSDKELQ